MSDPYSYLRVMFIINAIFLLGYLIFTEKNVIDKVLRTLLTGSFMIWQAYILLVNNQV